MHHPFSVSFIHSFIHACIHLFTHAFTHSLVHLFIHSFVRSFTHSLTHSFNHSFVHSFIHFIHSFFHFIPFHSIPFIHSFGHSRIDSLVIDFMSLHWHLNHQCSLLQLPVCPGAATIWYRISHISLSISTFVVGHMITMTRKSWPWLIFAK